ncbi:unnamed protein product, partial [Ectocarpus sp. 8 AP-2014]
FLPPTITWQSVSPQVKRLTAAFGAGTCCLQPQRALRRNAKCKIFRISRPAITGRRLWQVSDNFVISSILPLTFFNRVLPHVFLLRCLLCFFRREISGRPCFLFGQSGAVATCAQRFPYHWLPFILPFYPEVFICKWVSYCHTYRGAC